ncbi:hypothetical protein VNO78_23163 [Psophocarpus tetragonolobus]|uniref:Uncharacterized protein n=1 Tax=Psophocarpus tetragonolobus TaxID=3891 RepID=A0AAN9XD21_PSOTE
MVPSPLSISLLTLRGCEDCFGVWTRWICRRQTSLPVARQRYRSFRFVAAIHGGDVFQRRVPLLLFDGGVWNERVEFVFADSIATFSPLIPYIIRRT